MRYNLNRLVLADAKGQFLDAKALINALNEDLANELQAVIMYTVYSAKVRRPVAPAARSVHADWRSPTSCCTRSSWLTRCRAGRRAGHDSGRGTEGDDCPRDAPGDCEAEQKAVAGYTERAKMAEEFGDKALVVQLEDMVRDEQGHMEETLKLLKNWEDR